MKRISTACLRNLEVINLCGGEKLGYPCDFELDIDGGRILAIIVPICEGGAFLSKKDEYVIPWCDIECIGEDAILIKMQRSQLEGCRCAPKSTKKRGFFK